LRLALDDMQGQSILDGVQYAQKLCVTTNSDRVREATLTSQSSASLSGYRKSFFSQHREWIITALGVLGLILFVSFYDQAFPSAAIDLSLSRAEITERAVSYMTSLGYELDDYKYALTFSQGSWASLYLQRTLGIPETNRLIQIGRASCRERV